MTGRRHRFDPGELDDASDPELTSAAAAARAVEQTADAPRAVIPADDPAFLTRVMAAVRTEPTPRPASAAWAALLAGRPRRLLAALRDGVRVAVSPSRPVWSRLQAAPVALLAVALVVGSTGLIMVGASQVLFQVAPSEPAPEERPSASPPGLSAAPSPSSVPPPSGAPSSAPATVVSPSSGPTGPASPPSATHEPAATSPATSEPSSVSTNGPGRTASPTAGPSAASASQPAAATPTTVAPDPTPTPSTSPARSAEPSGSPTPSAEPSGSAEPSRSPRPSETPDSSETPEPTQTPEATETPDPSEDTAGHG